MAGDEGGEGAGEGGHGFFGFDTTRFIDDACVAVEDYIADGIDAFEKHVAKRHGNKEEVAACANALQKRFKTVADKSFDRYEVYLKRNVFVKPQAREAGEAKAEVVADAEETAEVAPSTKRLREEENKLDEEIARAEREIRKMIRENEGLQAQVKQAEGLLERNQQSVAALAVLKEAPDANAKMDAVLKHSRDLRQTIGAAEDLRKDLPALAAGAAGAAAAATPSAERTLKMQDARIESVKRLRARLFAQTPPSS